ncbi:MAG TPA: hypothetical protein DCS93_01500 [Microscillaceae bacterium]|nr:hypothetical protein [Microscillaceae bacterium]
MQTHFSIWAAISLIGAVQGVFLVVTLLLSAKKLKKASLMLVTLASILSFQMLDQFAITTGLWYSLYRIFFIPMPLVYMPLLWFYALFIINHQRGWKKQDWWHILPFVVAELILVIVYTNYRHSEHLFDHITAVNVWLAYGKGVHLMLYSAFILRLLNRHIWQKGILGLPHNNYLNIIWLRRTLWVAMGVFVVIYTLISLTYLRIIQVNVDLYLGLILSVFLYSVAYMAIRYPIIFMYEASEPYPQVSSSLASMPQSSVIGLGVDEHKEKYQTSPLTSAQKLHYKQLLLDHLEIHQAFTDNELTLKTLSEQMSVSAYHLSQVMNEELNKNFYELINHYRVEAVKASLANPQAHQTNLLSIAYDAGFNSKSSFNRIFKKSTGITPSEYRKKLTR